MPAPVDPNSGRGRYTKLERIGSGSFGEVFRGVDNNSGENVAIKVINLENDPEGLDEIRKEISVLGHCDSTNIIRYRGSYLVGPKLWIVMDYCAWGSFRQIIETLGPLGEQQVFFITKEVLSALSYLHANKIIHRDIKAANILLTEDGMVKLGDFGVASPMGGNMRRNALVGSPYWMAPEVIKRSQYDAKADIWSLGITIYELLMGNPPLVQLEPAKAILIIPRNAPHRLDQTFSPLMRSLVEACLNDDPGKRPSADELLKHKAFRNVKKSSLTETMTRYSQTRKNRELLELKSPRSTLLDLAVGEHNWCFGTLEHEGPNEEVLSPSRLQAGSSVEVSSTTEDLANLQIQGDSPHISPAPPSLENGPRISITSLHIRQPTSNSSILFSHKRQSSLLSLSIDEATGSTNMIDDIGHDMAREYDHALQIYPWPYNIVGETGNNAQELLSLMISLKRAARDLPRKSDPLADPQALREHIEDHLKFSRNYIATLLESVSSLLGHIPD